jgi:hypothetical protein
MEVSKLLLLMVAGCGPVVIPPGDTDTDAMAVTGSSTEAAHLPSTSTATSTATSAPPSTTTSDTTGGSESTDEGVVFLRPTDGGPTSTCACDLSGQGGYECPEGEKCMPWANDGGDAWNCTRCSPLADNPGQPGDECSVEGSGVSGIDDCDVGSMCWDVDPETNMGTCVAMCTGDEASPWCKDPGTDCFIANDGVLILCLPTCDPLGDQCAPGQSCTPSEQAFVCVPTGDGAVAGEPCQHVYDCEPGLVCESSASVGPPCGEGRLQCCTPYCDLSQADPAAACSDPGQVCAPWWDEQQAPVGFENVGVCALP